MPAAAFGEPAQDHLQCFTALERLRKVNGGLGWLLWAILVPLLFLATTALETAAEPSKRWQSDRERSENQEEAVNIGKCVTAAKSHDGRW